MKAKPSTERSILLPCKSLFVVKSQSGRSTSQELDHSYHHSFKQISIGQQYVDDTGWATRNKKEVKAIKEVATSKLKERNLGVNETKTEEYEVK